MPSVSGMYGLFKKKNHIKQNMCEKAIPKKEKQVENKNAINY